MIRIPIFLKQLQAGRQLASVSLVLQIGKDRFAVSTPGVGGHLTVESLPALRRATLRSSGHHWTGSERTKLDLKLRWRGYLDPGDHDRERDILEIQNITVHPSQRRQGLATALLRNVARIYPEALIQGSNPSADAIAWHRHLNLEMPTRMLEFPSATGIDARVRLNAQLNFRELEPEEATEDSEIA